VDDVTTDLDFEGYGLAPVGFLGEERGND